MHSRRELLWLGVTSCPDAEWIARQLTEACGWRKVPRYLVRDRDGAYGEIFIDVLGRWAYGIDRSPHGHPGKMDTRRGLLARSGGNALTMWLFSENCTFGIC
jgi:hypothetical protein